MGDSPTLAHIVGLRAEKFMDLTPWLTRWVPWQALEWDAGTREARLCRVSSVNMKRFAMKSF